MNRKLLAILAAAALGAVAISCGGKSASDQSITTDIQAKLYADATTKAANINVAVKDGVVTLSGDVPSSDVELEAMKVANATAGVKSLSDQLKVNPAAAGAQLPNAGNPQAPAGEPSSSAAATPPAVAPPGAASPAPAASPERAPAPAAAPVAAAEPAPPPQPRIVHITAPAGTSFSVRTIDSIDSKNNTTGQTFRATLEGPLAHNGRTVIPSGSPVTLTLTNAKSAGRIKGSSELAVAATSIEYHGQAYNVDTSAVEQQGKGRGKQTAVRTGIGAAAGALIGGLAGGGKGAGIGALAGGGAGVGFQALTHGEQVKIPSETVLTFTLTSPLTVEKTVR